MSSNDLQTAAGFLSMFAFLRLVAANSWQILTGRWSHPLSNLTEGRIRQFLTGIMLGTVGTGSYPVQLAALSFSRSGSLSFRGAAALGFGAQAGVGLILLFFAIAFFTLNNPSMLYGALAITAALFLVVGKTSWQFAARGFFFLVMALIMGQLVHVETMTTLWKLPLLVFAVSIAIGGLTRSSLFPLLFAFFNWSPQNTTTDSAIAAVFGGAIGVCLPFLLSARRLRREDRRLLLLFCLFHLTTPFVFLIASHWYASFYHGFSFPVLYFFSSIGLGALFTVLLPVLEKTARVLIRDAPEKEPQRLSYLGFATEIPPVLALDLLHQEVRKLAALVHRQLHLLGELFLGRDVDGDAAERIEKYERITDNVKREVLHFSHELHGSRLSHDQARSLRRLVRITSELERVADEAKQGLHDWQAAKSLSGEPARLADEFIVLWRRSFSFFESFFAQLTGDLESNHEVLRNQVASLRETIAVLHQRNLPAPSGHLVVTLNALVEHSLNMIEALQGQKVSTTPIGAPIKEPRTEP